MGHDPTRGTGQGVSKWRGSGRVGSGRVGFGRVMTREIRVTRKSRHHDPRAVLG